MSAGTGFQFQSIHLNRPTDSCERANVCVLHSRSRYLCTSVALAKTHLINGDFISQMKTNTIGILLGRVPPARLTASAHTSVAFVVCVCVSVCFEHLDLCSRVDLMLKHKFTFYILIGA